MKPVESSPLVGEKEGVNPPLGETHQVMNKTWRQVLQEESVPGWESSGTPHLRTVVMTLDDFVHQPNLYYEETPPNTSRRIRSHRHRHYVPNPGTFLAAISAVFNSKLRAATIFGSSRLWVVIIFHAILATGLAVAYFFIPLVAPDFVAGIKDFVDVCVTGIIFLLGGFVTMMMSRWTAFRRDCLANLHSALVNQSMYAATIWPKRTPVNREARALVARYSLAVFHLLFLEARVSDFPYGRHETVTDAIADLVRIKLLLEPEARALQMLPVPSAVVLGWLSRFWECVMDKESTLECAGGFARNADPGRYSTIFKEVFAARNAITLCHSYMQTQIPYGYIHLIIMLVHATCLANSIFCGIHFGNVLEQTYAKNNGEDGIKVLVPLAIVRSLRIVLVPLLLDGMIFVGTVIAMPMGTDEDDYPAGAFVECLEDECLAVGASMEAFQPEMLLTKKGGKPPDLAAPTGIPPTQSGPPVTMGAVATGRSGFNL